MANVVFATSTFVTCYVLDADLLTDQSVPDATIASFALSSDGSCLAWAHQGAPLAYALGFEAIQLDIIDTVGYSVAGSIPFPGSPPFSGNYPFLAISPDGTKAYASQTGLNPTFVSKVWPIDLVGMAWAATPIDLSLTGTAYFSPPFFNFPIYGIAFTPDGTTAYACNGYRPGEGPGPQVCAIDTATDTITASIDVDPSPISVAVTPDGATAYVVCLGNDTAHDYPGSVVPIDVATNTAGASIPLIDQSGSGGGSPCYITITPDGKRAFVANYYGLPDVIDLTHGTAALWTDNGLSSAVIGDANWLQIGPDGSTIFDNAIGNLSAYLIMPTPADGIGQVALAALSPPPIFMFLGAYSVVLPGWVLGHIQVTPTAPPGKWRIGTAC